MMNLKFLTTKESGMFDKVHIGQKWFHLTEE